jgi:hypothetical protein
MIEIRACAAYFAQLVAAEKTPYRGFRRFAARLIRGSQIRGHDKKRAEPENSLEAACLELLPMGSSRSDGRACDRASSLTSFANFRKTAKRASASPVPITNAMGEGIIIVYAYCSWPSFQH